MLVQVRPAHPSAQIADLERAIDGLFQRVWRSQSPVFSRGHSPFALARDADGVTLRAEIPGVEPDAIDVRVEGRKLAMHPERKPEAREGGCPARARARVRKDRACVAAVRRSDADA
ncbi:MAG: Hsp20/alpha crystallin family protein [Candidatus Binatia bacterium]